MSKGSQHIFSETACLTLEQLKGYAEGTLSAEQTKEAEKHLADCEICSDALEGMMENNVSPAVFTEQVEQINRRIRKKYVRQHTLFFSPVRITVAAAAVLLMVVGAGVLVNFFLYKDLKYVSGKLDKLKNQVSEINIFSGNKQKEDTIVVKHNIAANGSVANNNSADAPPVLDEETALTDSIFKDLTQEENQGNTVVTVDAKDNTEPEKVAAAESEYNGAAANNAVTLKQNAYKSTEGYSVVASAPVMPQRSTMSNYDNDKPAAVAKNESLSKTKSTIPDKNTVLTNEGIQQYGAKNYAKAIKLLEAAVAAQSTNYTARYYLAQSYFASELYIEAIRQFDVIIIDQADTYFDDARYYKALAHVRIDDPLTAQKILNELIAEESPYKKKAQAILNEMK